MTRHHQIHLSSLERPADRWAVPFRGDEDLERAEREARSSQLRAGDGTEDVAQGACASIATIEASSGFQLEKSTSTVPKRSSNL